MRNLICLLMIALLACGFGYSSDKKSTADTAKKSAYDTVDEVTNNAADTVDQGMKAVESVKAKVKVNPKAGEKAVKAAEPVTSAAAVPDAQQMQSVANALKALSGDTPEQTKARIEALKRLAAALNKSQQPEAGAAVSDAPVATTSAKRK